MKTVLKCLSVSMIIFSFTGLSVSVEPPVDQATVYDFSAINDRIQNWVDKSYYPGASILIAKDNKIVYEKYFGNYTPDTAVYIASAGKWLAAAAIAAVVDEGKLSWDDPVSKWLPEFKDDKGKATLRQLMSHTAGYPDYQKPPKQRDAYQTLIESVREIAPLEPNDIPGVKFQYGGLAMQVAGRMAELATGKDWESLFQEKIARPLQMKNTHFTPVDQGPGHAPMLGGAARCTLRDYANFLSMINNNGMFEGRRVLSEKAIAEMQADQVRGAKITKPEFVEIVRGNTHNGIYGLGEWREALDKQGNAILISSPSWAGAYPWIDKTCNVYGIFLTHVDTAVANPAHFSAFYSSPALAMMARQAIEDKGRFSTDSPPVKRGIVDIGDANLYYEIAGKGEPVILIHGHSLDHRMWDAQFMELAKKYQVIRYDLRGYGLSDIPKDGQDFMHVNDLRILMDKLQIPKAHLIGLSLGGFITIDALALYPERILSAVAASGTLFPVPGPEHPMGEQEKQKRYREIEQLRQKGVDVFKREWTEGIIRSGGSGREKIRPALWKMIEEWSAWQPLHLEPRLLLGESVLEKLKQQAPIEVPVLIMLNPGDGQTNVRNADQLLPFFPNGRKMMLTDTGHMCNMETPDAFNQTIIQFLDSVEKTKKNKQESVNEFKHGG
jgi:CubicO group peptidase (beta-lactamase class C family)/pimeloyl-ACP methyl ester carboxylesterase